MIGSRSREWVVIDGFKIVGMVALEGATHCVVRNCEVWREDNRARRQPRSRGGIPTRVGIRLEGSTMCLISNNLVHDISGPQHGNEAGMIMYYTKGLLIQNNEFNNCYRGIYDKTKGVRNTYRYNVLRQCHEGFHSGGGTAGVWNKEIVVHHNLFLEGGGVSLVIDEGARVYNNTFCGERGLWASRSQKGAPAFFNCILDRPATAFSLSAQFQRVGFCDYNCVYAARRWSERYSFEQMRRFTGFGEFTSRADPKFVNRSTLLIEKRYAQMVEEVFKEFDEFLRWVKFEVLKR